MSFFKRSIAVLMLIAFALPVTVFAAKKQCVILLHGLTRSHHAMEKLASLLRQENYIVINKDYPSTTQSIKKIANENLKPMVDECLKNNATVINFVTHSMGGIVLQLYLEHHQIRKLGRIVMLAPPNHGSPVSDLLQNNWLYRVMTGPAGQELKTDYLSTPNQIKLNSAYEIGVIAGTFNFVPFEYYLFHEPNDGAVAVSSTKTSYMKDFREVPASHPFIMDHPLTQFYILSFLKFGMFKQIVYVNNQPIRSRKVN